MSKKLYHVRAPKEMWAIMDPLDGTHLFRTETAAKKQLKSWERDAETCYDSVWDMTGPFKYVLANAEGETRRPSATHSGLT